MANYNSYTDVIADITDRFDDSSSSTNTTVRRLIAPVLWDIYRRRRWKFARKEGTVTTVASTESYDLASDYDFGGIYDVVNDTDKQILSLTSDRTFDSVLPNSTVTGSPLYYRLWGINTTSKVQKIQFHPIPDGVKTITYKYFRLPSVVDLSTDTSNDSGTPDLPQQYRELIVLGVVIELYKKDESQLSVSHEVKFENMLKQMAAQYADESDAFYVMRSEDELFRAGGPVLFFPSSYGPKVDPW